jgi:Nitrile hydratase beta subunit, N-terminal
VRPELDLEGAAAPPRANGELAFTEPWHSRLFATTMAACDAGLIDYPTFREHLIVQVARHELDGPGDYWAAWQDAFEALAFGAGLVGEKELGERAAAFAEHG